MPDVTFACPGLTTFCLLDELDLEVTEQRLDGVTAIGVDEHVWRCTRRRRSRPLRPKDSLTRSR
ncbi:hypothetical protein [Corynebacterium durum]|uniref:hypothetical protein n=1 Tax=Corynebacterium durum TaxID=61592 RepID=UPI002889B9B6|nr:hypothetical protein [Corynebacterium durum]